MNDARLYGFGERPRLAFPIRRKHAVLVLEKFADGARHTSREVMTSEPAGFSQGRSVASMIGVLAAKGLLQRDATTSPYTYRITEDGRAALAEAVEARPWRATA